jgi:uncharacterized protein YlxW (UPF0749 family)
MKWFMSRVMILGVIAGLLWFSKYSYDVVSASRVVELEEKNKSLEEEVTALQKINRSLNDQVKGNNKDETSKTEDTKVAESSEKVEEQPKPTTDNQ